MSKVYREKTMERISSPEQLNDYIRVTKPSVWLALAALLILLLGMLAWCILGTVQVQNKNGEIVSVHPILFITN